MEGKKDSQLVAICGDCHFVIHHGIEDGSLYKLDMRTTDDVLHGRKHANDIEILSLRGSEVGPNKPREKKRKQSRLQESQA